MPVKQYQVGKVLQLTPINEEMDEFNVDFFCKSETAEFHFAIVDQEQLDKGNPINFQQSVDKEISGNIKSNEGDRKSYFIALKSIEGTIDVLVSTVHKAIEKKVVQHPPQQQPPQQRLPQQQPPQQRLPQQQPLQQRPPQQRPPQQRPPQQRPPQQRPPQQQKRKRRTPPLRRNRESKPEIKKHSHGFPSEPKVNVKTMVIIGSLIVVVGVIAWLLFFSKSAKNKSIDIGGQDDYFSPSVKKVTASPSLIDKLKSLSVEK